MPRTCTVCAHPRRPAIDRALVARQSLRDIAGQFSLTKSALERHRREHLPATLLAALEAQEAAEAADVLAELRRCMERVQLLFDACDAWLRDPEDPECYTLVPRAHDVQVVYLAPVDGGKPVRKKAPLSALLMRLQEGGVRVEHWETKHADPRELVLKTAGQLQGHLELLAELEGKLSRQPVVNLQVHPEWLALRRRIVAELAPYPEARVALAGALGNGHAGH